MQQNKRYYNKLQVETDHLHYCLRQMKFLLKKNSYYIYSNAKASTMHRSHDNKDSYFSLAYKTRFHSVKHRGSIRTN